MFLCINLKVTDQNYYHHLSNNFPANFCNTMLLGDFTTKCYFEIKIKNIGFGFDKETCLSV